MAGCPAQRGVRRMAFGPHPGGLSLLPDAARTKAWQARNGTAVSTRRTSH